MTMVTSTGTATAPLPREVREPLPDEGHKAYASLLESSPDMAWTKDSLLRLTSCNAAMAAAIGAPTSEILGRTILHLLPAMVARPMEESDRQVLQTGRPVTIEERITTRGIVRIIETSKSPIRDSRGRITGLLGVSRDITARREAEARLHGSEERYRTLFHDVPVGLYRTRANGEILHVNAILARMFGHEDPSALEGGTLSLDYYVDTADRDRWRAILQRTGTVRGFEMRQRTADGRTIWVRLNGRAQRSADGRVLYYEGSIEDITELRAAEASARHSADTLSTILEAAPVGVIVMDADGHIDMWNASADRILGWQGRDVRGSTFPFPDAATGPDLRARLDEVTRLARVVRVEGTVAHPDQPVHVAVSLAPLPASDQGAAGVVAVVDDVTVQRSLEDQLRHAQKMEAVGTLAGGIAHDFNNVMTAIGGHVELLLDDIPDEHPHHADLTEIRTGVDRAAALTKHLLAFSRQQVLQPRVLDLRHVVQRVEPMLRRLIRENIRLTTRLGDHPRWVRIDPNRIEQVIINLIVNARDAISGPGSIEIGVADSTLGADHGEHGLPPGRYVHLTVSDTGSGIDAATMGHIFDPFFTTKEPGAGTGLGLSTAYGTIKQSGGHLGVCSTPGEGATFEIVLPLFAAPAEPESAAPVRPSPHLSAGETILLVEDEPAVRELARRVLHRAGYVVLTADRPSAAEATLARGTSIDLLVTDVVMPEMNGNALARRIRTSLPHMPVILMSGYTGDDLAGDGAILPNSTFLEKPFTPARLVAVVGAALSNARH